MEVRKNAINKGIITDLNDDGQGVLKMDGKVVFVPNALPNEEVEVQVIKTYSKYAIGKVLNFLKTSPDRITPPCPHFSKCGGCDIMHLNEKAQSEFKTKKVRGALKKITGIDFEVLPTINLNSLRYRNKLSLPVAPNGEIGLYRKNTHSVLPILDCLITKEWNKTLIKCVQEYIQLSEISIYNENTQKGLLKHVVARSIDSSILVTLVINGTEIPKQNLLVDLLKKSFSNFGLNLNINTLHNNVILSSKWKHLYGIDVLQADELGVIYPVSNASFYQVNNEIKNAIYSSVLNEIDENMVVVDAYSGAGLMSGIISTKAKKCYGIEIVKEAIQNANELKAKNNLKNLENICGDCTKELPKLVKSLAGQYWALTLDPPRKGCDKKVLDAILFSKPHKIIYISCDPNTLARDLKIILDSNLYQLKKVQPYDMFPNTKHVETVAILELQEK